MPIDGLQFMRGLKAQSLQPVYYLFGDGFLVERCLERLVEIVLPPSQREVALEVYRSDTPPETILDTALTVPFFSRRKVVVVKDAHLFSPTELERFIPYIERPSPQTLLLFLGETIDRRKGFYQALEGRGGVVEFAPVRGKELLGWVKRGFRELGLEITVPAAQLLIEMVGEDLRALSKEMEKLRGFCEGRSRIDVEDIRLLTASIRPQRVFDLMDRVRDGDVKGAMRVLGRLMDEGEGAPGIIALLARYFRILWMLKSFPPEEVGRRFRIPRGLLHRYIRESQGLKEEDLSMAYKALFQAERAVKTGSLPEREILRDLVLNLILRRSFQDGLRGGKEGVYPPGKP